MCPLYFLRLYNCQPDGVLHLPYEVKFYQLVNFDLNFDRQVLDMRLEAC